MKTHAKHLHFYTANMKTHAKHLHFYTAKSPSTLHFQLLV